MTSRMFVVFSLLAGSTVAQVGAGNISEASTGRQLELEVKPNDLSHNAPVVGSALVSASDLTAPSRARKELSKANELIARQELSQAIQRLNRAIAIHPTYAVAYNNLGVIYSRLGDFVREQEALKKAISLNDHFVLAYVNLGRMNIAANDFASAEGALDKASACDPTDPMALILLSYSQFMQQRFDQVVATSRRRMGWRNPTLLYTALRRGPLSKRGKERMRLRNSRCFLKRNRKAHAPRLFARNWRR